MYLFRDKTEYVLYTKLDIYECSRRLKALIGKQRFSLFSLSGFADSKAIVGKIDGDKFRLQKRDGLRNSVDQSFYGQFNRRHDGIEIKGFFSMSLLLKAFMVFSVLKTLVLFTIFFINTNGEIFNKKGDYTGFISLSLFILFGLLVYTMLLKFSQWRARYRKKYVIEFLRETIEAQYWLET